MPLSLYLTRPLSWLRAGYPRGTAQWVRPLDRLVPGPPAQPGGFPDPGELPALSAAPTKQGDCTATRNLRKAAPSTGLDTAARSMSQ